MKKMASFIASLSFLSFLSIPLFPTESVLPPEPPQNSSYIQVLPQEQIDEPDQQASQATLPDIIIDEH